MEKRECSCTVVGMQIDTATMEDGISSVQFSHSVGKMVWRFHKNPGIKLTYDLTIPLLGIYPEETKTEKDTCIPFFFAALLTIARTWKQPRYPSTDEGIKKLWYIYTMEYYSAIKGTHLSHF